MGPFQPDHRGEGPEVTSPRTGQEEIPRALRFNRWIMDTSHFCVCYENQTYLKTKSFSKNELVVIFNHTIKYRQEYIVTH